MPVAFITGLRLNDVWAERRSSAIDITDESVTASELPLRTEVLLVLAASRKAFSTRPRGYCFSHLMACGVFNRLSIDGIPFRVADFVLLSFKALCAFDMPGDRLKEQPAVGVAEDFF